MTINFFRWHELDAATRTRILRRSQETIDGVLDAVRPILADVKEHGDDALIRYAAKFDRREPDARHDQGERRRICCRPRTP